LGQRLKEQQPTGFRRAVYTTSSMLMYLSTGLLLVMLLLGTADVLGRYFFNRPLSGSQEIFEILLPGIVLLGWAYAQRLKVHVSVDILFNRFQPRFKAIVALLTTCLALTISVLTVWQGALLSLSYFKMGRLIRNINVPIFIPRLLVPLGAFVLFLVLIVDLYDNVKEMKKG
jgi:TRAP-type C4-dicarboxylate transport system permease small subunit